MTTIEIYERVPYDRKYHRYKCKWGKNFWFFSDNKSYNTRFECASGSIGTNAYSHLVDTFVTPILPKNDKDLLLLVHTHMPELFV